MRQFNEYNNILKLSKETLNNLPDLDKLKELPQKFKEVFLTLAERSWFLDLDLTPKETFQFLSDSVEEVDLKLMERFTSRLSEIKNSIIEDYPRRKKIIEAAFKAHQKEDYILSIPVLIAQADGICKEKIKGNIFQKKGKKNIARYLKDINSESFISIVMNLLIKSLPIWITEKKRKGLKEIDEFNRHMILHGESLNYGTKINSLKAISFLNFVVEVFRNGLE